MKNKSVALTDMVISLGYKNSSQISNRIRDILKEKEDFKKRYVVDEKKGSYGRSEKFLVSEDAKTLVDNIAIIQQYESLFSRASTGETNMLRYYRELRAGIDKETFKENVFTQTTKFNQYISRSKESLENLPIFAKVILETSKLDICDTSIRTLMENADSRNLINFGKTYELAAWNELIELQNKVSLGENTSLNHQLIGDLFLSIGDVEQALIAFEESVELDPKNGVAWALMALANYKRLTKQHKEVHTALARTDFNGFIENPIDAEEYWINEQIDETLNDVTNSEKRFVDAAIQGLQHWPEWDNEPRTLSDGRKKPNYYYHLNQSRNTSIELTRKKLFLLLLCHIKHENFIQHRDVCVEILRSFQHWDPQNNPLTSIMLMPLDACGSLLQLISWIDKDEFIIALRELAKNIANNHYSPSKSIQFLKSPQISEMFWKYMGRESYLNLFVSLEKKEQKKLTNSRIELLAELQIKDVLLCFTDLLIQLQEEWLHNWLPMPDEPKNVNKPVWSQNAMIQLENSCRCSLDVLDGWESLISVVTSDSKDSPSSAQVLIFLSAFVEISNRLHIDSNTEILIFFASNESSFSTIRRHINRHLRSLFFESILHSKNYEGTRLREIVLKLVELDYALESDEDDFFDCNLL
ncbi:tetratricopeptide repeat protein [Tolumonas lignilytica]|uniref:tetratricopeptide repeat protein n=1 Tax=Tolumonas lignilytica TaxID=1283284 RepID=UPI000463690F|nr:hypothetical protein [Tolumonas lignilytica]